MDRCRDLGPSVAAAGKSIAAESPPPPSSRRSSGSYFGEVSEGLLVLLEVSHSKGVCINQCPASSDELGDTDFRSAIRSAMYSHKF